jgi:DNA-binding ferritin-like protein
MGYLEKMKTGGTKTSIASLVAEMLDAANKFHILHLTVTGKGSYAAHKALGDLYEALPGLADGVAEGYQGVTGKLLEYPDVSAPRLKTVEDAIDYIEALHNKVSKVQDGVEFTEIVNDLDTIKSELNSAKYKLKFLS